MSECMVYHQDGIKSYGKSEIWWNSEDNEVIEVENDQWSTKNFFRWVVDEVSTNLNYEEVLFPIPPTENMHCTLSDSSDGIFEQYDEQTVPVVGDDAKQIYSDCSTESQHIETITQRGPGRPRTLISHKKDTQTKKTGKLWEFLRNLLLDEKTCPSLIKWDNHNEGTFKFVQSEKVAQLWGSRKRNNKMNYEKLSRAMRYYYRSQVLLPVAGKRLVYKFGPQATGWRTPNPIL